PAPLPNGGRPGSIAGAEARRAGPRPGEALPPPIHPVGPERRSSDIGRGGVSSSRGEGMHRIDQTVARTRALPSDPLDSRWTARAPHPGTEGWPVSSLSAVAPPSRPVEPSPRHEQSSAPPRFHLPSVGPSDEEWARAKEAAFRLAAIVESSQDAI